MASRHGGNDDQNHILSRTVGLNPFGTVHVSFDAYGSKK